MFFKVIIIMKNIAQSKTYENFGMLHPDGKLMCYCKSKRAHWYVNHNLATWIDSYNFKLNFIPNGYGKSDDPYYVQSLENRCVVCGSEENLNKHHVVPYVFRSRFPIEYKESNHHDILVTCVACHENYELHATKYKLELAKELGLSFNLNVDPQIEENKKILSARRILNKLNNHLIVNKNNEPCSIPMEKLLILQNKASQEIKEEQKVNVIWADKIVENILSNNTILEFVCSWRNHFLIHTKPKYLPKHWSVNKELEKSNQ